MSGDRNYRRYFLFLTSITITTLLMAGSDNILMFISFWLLSNLILVFLMMHKSQWKAARNSGKLTIKTFTLGLVLLSTCAGLLAYESGSLSLHFICENSESLSASTRMLSLFLIMLAALSQSGCWPFHRWLVSSLNSPTPISAFMHAGLINGGGLLIVRFASIFLHESLLLDVLFILGIITVILGGIWKLLQSNTKRMLACSTMTQMGFMMMQSALGLFPAALAHLCWHGLFKAFLFLRSGSSVTEYQHLDEERVSTIPIFLLSSLCGLTGAIGFVFGSGLSFNLLNTTVILVFFCWMATTQIAHTLLRKNQSLFFILMASLFCLSTGYIYGITIEVIELAVAPLQILQPQALNFIHIIGIGFIFIIWINLNLKPFSQHEGSVWWRHFYVKMLNASQPDPKTTTSDRNEYKF